MYECKHNDRIVYELPKMTYWSVYKDIAEEQNVLIGGTTGSGKSVCLDGIIRYLAVSKHPSAVVGGGKLWLADPKRVDLNHYRSLPHTERYADTPEEIVQMMIDLADEMDARYDDMKARGIRKWDGGEIWLIIDELGDLMTTYRKEVQPCLTHLLQLCRASGIHIICCTQCPARAVISATLQINFTSALALRCASAIESRQIIKMPGAELLPRYGTGILLIGGEGCKEVKLPLTTDEQIDELLDYYTEQKKRKTQTYRKWYSWN